MTDAHLSIRFRHGVHTIYLFVDSSAPFSEITKELRELVAERYPYGLTTCLDPPKTTTVDDEDRFAYAVLTVPKDPTRGWKRLKMDDSEDTTPSKAGLKDNSIVAFMPVGSEEAEGEVEFEVEWPAEEEEEEV